MIHSTLRRRAAGVLAIIVCLIATLTASADAKRLPDGRYQHTFEFKPEGNPKRVNVAGSFNNWSADANPMKRDNDGVWRASIPLAEGVHHYKFVIDGNNWVNDPKADPSLNEGDNYGGTNSGVFVGPDGRKLPPAQPNAINLDAVNHDRTDLRDVNVVSRELLLLALRMQADDAQKVVARVQADKSGQWETYPLVRTTSQHGFDRFGTMIPTKARSLTYYFELTDGSKTTQYPPRSQTSAEEARAIYFSVHMQPKFETPDWAKHAVWYQIFPEQNTRTDENTITT